MAQGRVAEAEGLRDLDVLEGQARGFVRNWVWGVEERERSGMIQGQVLNNWEGGLSLID